jgi:isocitrate/isopropylmalate dehydrogenase
MIHKPWDYDVMVTENIFGDILSDLTAGRAAEGQGFTVGRSSNKKQSGRQT